MCKFLHCTLFRIHAKFCYENDCHRHLHFGNVFLNSNLLIQNLKRKSHSLEILLRSFKAVSSKGSSFYYYYLENANYIIIASPQNQHLAWSVFFFKKTYFTSYWICRFDEVCQSRYSTAENKNINYRKLIISIQLLFSSVFARWMEVIYEIHGKYQFMIKEQKLILQE